MDRPQLLDRAATPPTSDASMRIVEYVLAALALLAALLLGLAH